MVIFHSYVNVYQRLTTVILNFLRKKYYPVISNGNETAPHFDDFPIKLHSIFQIFQLAMFDYQIQNEPT